EIFAGLLVDHLHGQPHLAALVKAEQLDFHFIAFLDDIGGLLHAPRRQLADMHQAILGAEEVHEGAEIPDLDHCAFIDVTYLRLRGNRLDPIDRSFDRFRFRRCYFDGAIVGDIDLGAGLLHDFADDLAARTDDLADFIDRYREHLDARSVFAK